MGPRWSPLCDRVTCAQPTGKRVPQGPENQSRLYSRPTDGVLCLDGVRPLSVNCALNSARFAERQYAGVRAVVWLDWAGRDQGASIYVRLDDGSGEADVAPSHVLIGWLEALSSDMVVLLLSTVSYVRLVLSHAQKRTRVVLLPSLRVYVYTTIDHPEANVHMKSCGHIRYGDIRSSPYQVLRRYSWSLHTCRHKQNL